MSNSSSSYSFVLNVIDGFQAKRALKSVLQKCTHLPALQALLADAPASVIEYVVAQFAKILPNDPKARRQFVTSGGLKKVRL